jgi:hypothetical protein
MPPLLNLTGRKFGKLTVIERGPDAKCRRSRWFVECECGKSRLLQASSLSSGNTKSCGCSQYDWHRTPDLTGRIFGRLTILSRDISQGLIPSRWHVLCQCGEKKSVIGGSLTRKEKAVRSCGCFRIKAISSFRMLLRRYKNSAKKRKMVFSLTEKQMQTLIRRKCFYCGVLPETVLKRGRGIPLIYNGIDRKNALHGYEIKNCVPCCHTCNFMKNILTVKEFVNQCKRVAILWGINV